MVRRAAAWAQALSRRSRRCSDASECSPALSSVAPRTRMGQATALQSVTDRLRKCSAYRSRDFGLHSKAATGTTSSMRARKRRDRCRERADTRRREHQFYSRGPRAFALATTGRRFDLRDSNMTCRDRRRFSPRLPRRPCSWLAHPDGNMRLLRPARLCHSDDPRRVAPAGQGPRECRAMRMALSAVHCDDLFHAETLGSLPDANRSRRSTSDSLRITASSPNAAMIPG